jgi:hypothetical protein
LDWLDDANRSLDRAVAALEMRPTTTHHPRQVPAARLMD